ncbi:hypothetical protein ES705_24008 [subsurface metagenome]
MTGGGIVPKTVSALEAISEVKKIVEPITIGFAGEVYENEDTATTDDPRRFETSSRKLRDLIIQVSGNDQLFGNEANQRYKVAVGDTIGFTQLELSQLYFKNAVAGQNGTVNILGLDGAFLSIDIGEAAVYRAGSTAEHDTHINTGNPANASGIIDTVEIWAKDTLTGCKVGTFYKTNEDTLKCRSVVEIGDVSSGSKQTFTGLSLTVVAGDYIGFCSDSGRVAYISYGGAGMWHKMGDSCVFDAEATYDFLEDWIMSLYGTGWVT